MQVNVHAAKSSLFRLLAAVDRGEEVIIARAGKPAARLVAMKKKASPKRPTGLPQGSWISPGFDKEDPELTR